MTSTSSGTVLGTWVWDLITNRVTWSAELYRILGYDPDRDQATVEAFFAAVDPADRERVRSASASGAASGRGNAIAFRLLTSQGVRREVLMDGAPLLDAAGRHTGFAGTVLDITERLAVERELRRRTRLLDEAQRSAHVGSWTWSPRSGRVEWSAELYRIFGVAPQTPVDEQLFFSLVHPEDRDRLMEVAVLARGSESLEAHEHRIVRQDDGAVRHLLTAGKPVEEEDGEAIYVGTCLDITERRELEAKLFQAQKMEAIGRLAGGIAHDFNNLLTIVTGFVSLLRERAPSEELDQIAAAAATGARLTRQLLLFSRQAVIEPRTLSLNDAVSESVRLIERTIGEDIEIGLTLEPDLWPIRLDPGQLQQILLNLAVNARDAMPEGGSLALATSNRRSEDGGDWVELAVRDDGVGMDAATRARVFEPFFTTKPRGRGTGLGLATVFGIVTGAGGTIRVESTPGAGACFVITFPRAFEAPDPDRRRELTAAPTGAPRTLLVVEDEPAIVDLLRGFLVGRGFAVEVATHPVAALELWQARSGEVAAVICDLVLPGMSGRALATRLRAHRPDLPVLFVSGYSEDLPAMRGTLDRATAFLPKPFELEAVASALASLLAERSGAE